MRTCESSNFDGNSTSEFGSLGYYFGSIHRVQNRLGNRDARTAGRKLILSALLAPLATGSDQRWQETQKSDMHVCVCECDCLPACVCGQHERSYPSLHTPVHFV
jgi:hypothetical protein